MRVYGSIYWSVVKCVVSEVGRGFNDEVESDVFDEDGEGVELDVEGKFVSINMSNMKSILILVAM